MRFFPACVCCGGTITCTCCPSLALDTVTAVVALESGTASDGDISGTYTIPVVVSGTCAWTYSQFLQGNATNGCKLSFTLSCGAGGTSCADFTLQVTLTNYISGVATVIFNVVASPAGGCTCSPLSLDFLFTVVGSVVVCVIDWNNAQYSVTISP
jgi:hypothetical protein